MPFTTELTDDFMGIVHLGTGLVTGQEIIEGCRSVTALVQTTENFHFKLVDFSAATNLQISAEELEQVMEEDRLIAVSRPHAVAAVVVPNDAIGGVVRMWQKHVEELGWQTHVAGTRDEAWAWLREHSGFAQVG